MSMPKELILLVHDDLRREIENVQPLSELLRSGSSESLTSLLAKLSDRGFPAAGLKYLLALIVLKGQEVAPITLDQSKAVLGCYEQLCNMLGAQPNDYFSTVNSMLCTNIMACENMSEIFEWGKVLLGLKALNIDISMLESVLDISYSPLIFETATDSSKERNQEGLKCLIKASKLNLDSTGALQAIVGNSLQWIENSNDFYEINRAIGQEVVPDQGATQEINGLLKLLPIEDQDMATRSKTLADRYGSNLVIVNYPEEYVEEDKTGEEDPRFYASEGSDIIRGLADITMEQDSFKSSMNTEKTIQTLMYRATIIGRGERIAVKKIKVTNNADLEKYGLEVKIMRELSGSAECFLKFYGSFRVQNDLYILMEYVEDTLMDKMVRDQLNEIQKLSIAQKLVQGFAFMAQKHIYHRDIKPHNILITQDNKPKIIDFGITIFNENPDVTTTMAGAGSGRHIQGTPGYMSPEQRNAFDAYKSDKSKPIQKYNFLKSDVYSLGLTFYQMLTGQDVSKFELRANHPEFLQLVSRLGDNKMKAGIEKMVVLEPSKRCDFNQLISLISGVTTTFV